MVLLFVHTKIVRISAPMWGNFSAKCVLPSSTLDAASPHPMVREADRLRGRI